MNEDVEIISKSINWEEVRCRAAIAFMPSIMQVHELKVAVNFISKKDGSDMPEMVAEIAVMYADALVERLKNKK